MSELLTNLSNALADVVESAGASVVRVEARRRLAATGVIWTADGLIVTASHVIEDDDRINAGLPGGETVAAKLVGRDDTTDLALLRAEATGLKPASWAAIEDLRVGHLALALGRPGQTVQATLGVVSALGKEWRTHAGGVIDRYLQTDVVMYPGFSGGPLVSVAGQVIGLNSSALVRGVSITVPAPTVTRVAEALLAHGRVRRGYLGVGAQPARLPEALARQLGQETGLLLVSVEAGSPADRGGLTLGDTIVALNGQPVRHMDDLLAQLGGDVVGAAIPVKIVRGGQVQEMRVTVGERS